MRSRGEGVSPTTQVAFRNRGKRVNHMRDVRRSVIATVVGALLLTSCSSARHKRVEQIVDIGTHHLCLYRQGKGAPAVVIDVGLGDRAEHWGAIQTRLAGDTLVCVYDRAGYGRSDPGPLPRDSGRVAREIKAMLEAAHIPGPYVLVGHSLGGLNVQVFADLYPDEVAGLVLLDPPPLSWIRGACYPDLRATADRMTQEWKATADRYDRSSEARERSQAAHLRTLASEHDEMFGASGALAAGISSFGDVPVIVIASGRPNPMFGDVAAAYQTYWAEQSRRLAEKSSRGRFVLAEESSHNLYADAPELVVEAIRSAVIAARDG
jgi:pimeloyl-ACP methyl ester carboxylesterase